MSRETALQWQYSCMGHPIYTQNGQEECVHAGYTGCGHVLNGQIDAVPRDGVLRWITCDKCGAPTPVTKTPFAEEVA